VPDRQRPDTLILQDHYRPTGLQLTEQIGQLRPDLVHDESSASAGGCQFCLQTAVAIGNEGIAD
jgi:hypothetical protein